MSARDRRFDAADALPWQLAGARAWTADYEGLTAKVVAVKGGTKQSIRDADGKLLGQREIPDREYLGYIEDDSPAGLLEAHRRGAAYDLIRKHEVKTLSREFDGELWNEQQAERDERVRKDMLADETLPQAARDLMAEPAPPPLWDHVRIVEADLGRASDLMAEDIKAEFNLPDGGKVEGFINGYRRDANDGHVVLYIRDAAITEAAA